MYKVIFDKINTTFDKKYLGKNFFKILQNNNLTIQSFEQKNGVGRGAKKWISPKGNLYLTINQKIDTKNILKMSFYICYLVHKYFKKKYFINLDYKWPNDLYYKNKKIVGVVSKSEISSKNTFIQNGLGINLNKSPIKNSTSLSKIILKNISVLQFSKDLLKFLNNKLHLSINEVNLTNYLNTYLLDTFKLKHPIYNDGNIKIIKVDKDLSLIIQYNDEYKNIYFGELI